MATKPRSPRTTFWLFTAHDTTVEILGTKAAATNYAHRWFTYRGIDTTDITVVAK